MKATLRLARRATYADYLAVEQHSRHRHELIDGVIVAMAGGSDEHNALAGKLAMLLGMRLTTGCRSRSAVLDRRPHAQPLLQWLDHPWQAGSPTA
jgi:hypothetical protein